MGPDCERVIMHIIKMLFPPLNCSADMTVAIGLIKGSRAAVRGSLPCLTNLKSFTGRALSAGGPGRHPSGGVVRTRQNRCWIRAQSAPV